VRLEKLSTTDEHGFTRIKGKLKVEKRYSPDDEFL
jgi:hypothetical protein